MPLRLLLFAVLYWERQWQEWRESAQPRPVLQLSPVLPIVLYTGAAPWGSTRTLVELLGAPVAFHTFAPRWEPLIWNLADHPREELLASANAWLQALAVMRAADAEAEDSLGSSRRRRVAWRDWRRPIRCAGRS